MKNITKEHENSIAQLLIKAHTIGYLRNEGDFNNAKYHTFQTLDFAKVLLEDEGSNENKLAFLEKISVDLKKFKIT